MARGSVVGEKKIISRRSVESELKDQKLFWKSMVKLAADQKHGSL